MAIVDIIGIVIAVLLVIMIAVYIYIAYIVKDEPKFHSADELESISLLAETSIKHKREIATYKLYCRLQARMFRLAARGERIMIIKFLSKRKYNHVYLTKLLEAQGYKVWTHYWDFDEHSFFLEVKW